MSETPNTRRPTRRTLLWWGAGGAAVATAGGGAAWIGAVNDRELIFGLIQRALPGVTLDRASVMTCVDDVRAQYRWWWMERRSAGMRVVSRLKFGALTTLGRVTGVDPLFKLPSAGVRFEDVTRVALTRLLPNSNFFYLSDPRSEPIVYTRPDPLQPCANPFTDLGPPPEQA